jgi:hypothetical protein
MNNPVEPQRLQPNRKEIRDRLESERERLYREIANYPRPIPACDQQFNHLLEERERICRELDSMIPLSGTEG